MKASFALEQAKAMEISFCEFSLEAVASVVPCAWNYATLDAPQCVVSFLIGG